MSSEVFLFEIVVESIGPPDIEEFSFDFRLDGFEWDFPKGGECLLFLPPDFLQSNEKNDLQLRVRSGQRTYAAGISVPECQEKSITVRGHTFLFGLNDTSQILPMEIAIRITRGCIKQIPSTCDSSVQTKKIEMRNARVQKITKEEPPPPEVREIVREVEIIKSPERKELADAVTETDTPVVPFTELESVVREVIDKHVKGKLVDVEVRQTREDPDANNNAKITKKTLATGRDKRNLGFSAVPRLQTLKVLDEMIQSRREVIAHLESRRIQRATTAPKKKSTETQTTVVVRPAKKEITSDRSRRTSKSPKRVEKKIRFTPPISPVASTTSSKSSSGNSSENKDERMSTEEETSKSESSSDQSSDRSSASSDRSREGEEEKELEKTESFLEMSPRDLSLTPPLSPTSLYLKQLRERVTREKENKGS